MDLLTRSKIIFLIFGISAGVVLGYVIKSKMPSEVVPPTPEKKSLSFTKVSIALMLLIKLVGTVGTARVLKHKPEKFWENAYKIIETAAKKYYRRTRPK